MINSKRPWRVNEPLAFPSESETSRRVLFLIALKDFWVTLSKLWRLATNMAGSG